MSNIATAGNLTAFHNWTPLLQPRPGPSPIQRTLDPPRPCDPPSYTRYTMAYDALSRLTNFTHAPVTEVVELGPCEQPHWRDYTYDRYGNLTGWLEQHGTELAQNKLLPVDESTNHLQHLADCYDPRGAMTSTLCSTAGPTNRLLTNAAGRMWGYFEKDPDRPTEMTDYQNFGYNWRGERMGIKKWESVVDNTGTGGTCFNWDTGTSTLANETWTIRDEGGKVLAEFDREPVSGAVWWVRDNYHLFGRTVAAYGAFMRNPAIEPINPEPSRDVSFDPPHHRYYFHDHLGNTRVVFNEFLADETYGWLQTFNYWPFGEEMWGDSYSGETTKYTGHERDYDLDLDYMMARHYSWELGRFLSPDPVNGSIHKPQSFNLFGYVRNNPMVWTDPRGLEVVHIEAYGPRNLFRSNIDPLYDVGWAGLGVDWTFLLSQQETVTHSYKYISNTAGIGAGETVVVDAKVSRINTYERRLISKDNRGNISWGKRWYANWELCNKPIFNWGLRPILNMIGTGSAAHSFGTPTFFQWARAGFGPIVSEGAKFTALEAGVLVTGTSAASAITVLVGYEVGVSVGSAINVTFIMPTDKTARDVW